MTQQAIMGADIVAGMPPSADFARESKPVADGN